MTFALVAMMVLERSTAQLTVQNTLTPEQLVQQVLAGPGVVITNVVFNGAAGNALTLQAGGFDGVNSNIGMDSGVILTNGNDTLATGPNNFTEGSTPPGGLQLPGDADVTQLLGTFGTLDAAVLEFDLVPTGDTVRLDFVFASEEYNEWVCSTFADGSGIFLSGPGITGPFSNGAVNIAVVPGTSVPIGVNTVNIGTPGLNGMAANCAALAPNWQSYSGNFIANPPNGSTVEYDGFTVVLTAASAVVPGLQYHLKIAVVDVADAHLDSGLLLRGGSLSSGPLPLGSNNLSAVRAGFAVLGTTLVASIGTTRARLEVFDTTGKMELRKEGLRSGDEVDLSLLSPGVHVGRLIPNDGTLVSKLFLLR